MASAFGWSEDGGAWRWSVAARSLLRSQHAALFPRASYRSARARSLAAAWMAFHKDLPRADDECFWRQVLREVDAALPADLLSAFAELWRQFEWTNWEYANAQHNVATWPSFNLALRLISREALRTGMSKPELVCVSARQETADRRVAQTMRYIQPAVAGDSRRL